MQRFSQESLSYRMALRLFDSAFAACERLPYEEQEALIREIGTRLLQRMPKSAVTAEPPPAVKITGLRVRVEDRRQADGHGNAIAKP